MKFTFRPSQAVRLGVVSLGIFCAIEGTFSAAAQAQDHAAGSGSMRAVKKAAVKKAPAKTATQILTEAVVSLQQQVAALSNHVVVLEATDPVPGPKGEKGERGEKGDLGQPGFKGDAGPVGPQGVRGEVGAVGPQGIQGAQGIAGPVGAVGPQGEVGPVGPRGAEGPVINTDYGRHFLSQEQETALSWACSGAIRGYGTSGLAAATDAQLESVPTANRIHLGSGNLVPGTYVLNFYGDVVQSSVPMAIGNEFFIKNESGNGAHTWKRLASIDDSRQASASNMFHFSTIVSVLNGEIEMVRPCGTVTVRGYNLFRIN